MRNGAERELPAVLLADHDHEGDVVVARAHDRVDGVAEPSSRVQVDERRAAGPERVAARHADDRSLVEPEDEVEAVREIGEERRSPSTLGSRRCA